MEPDPGVGQARLQFFPRAPTVARLSWTGGVCENGLRIDLERTGSDYAMWLRTEHPFGTMGCAALGVARAIEISFAEPPNAPIHVLWR